MKLMNALLGASCLIAAATSVAHAEDAVAPAAYPTEPAVAPTAPSKWNLHHNDQYCMPCCYGYNHLGVPYEIVARVGPSFVFGGNNLDEIMRTGTAWEIGARSFCYNTTHSAAWTAELSIGGVVNDGDKNEGVIRRLNDASITDVGLPPRETFEVDSRYAVLRLTRGHLQLKGGHEWYWYSDDPCGYRCGWGIDAGGRAGHAKAQLRLAQRFFTPTPDPDDLETLSEDRVVFHDTDTTYGFFASTTAFAVFPCWGYDVILGVRGEVARDWIDIVDGDDTLDQATLLFSLGIRY